ncbi:MAG: HAD family hydrolase [Dehalococcoidales bacterium]|nr:MAG: HAD family hydrolase [Dehalococcoidales bacterium]
MKYAAVIFDLFGTLVDKFPLEEHRKILQQMASVVSAPPDDFTRLWFDTYEERGMGTFQSYEANIEYICQKLGVKTDNSHVKFAVKINREGGARLMKPRPHSTELLAYLKTENYKTGLISDCGVEIPKIFNNMPFALLIDMAIFSSLVGMQKPDLRIYQLAAERLEVKPEDRLYIGDGDSNELTSALEAGMQPVLVRNPAEDHNDVYRTYFEGDDWQGPAISSLREVRDLIE